MNGLKHSETATGSESSKGRNVAGSVTQTGDCSSAWTNPSTVTVVESANTRSGNDRAGSAVAGASSGWGAGDDRAERDSIRSTTSSNN
jgi:hypothetical protein